jgi:hypothetical protein
MPPFTAALIAGGLAAGSGILSAQSGAAQADAQAMAQQMQQDQQNFQNRWNNEAQNRNILRQWQAQYHTNRQLERSSLQQAVAAQYYGTKAYQNATSELSKKTRQVTDQALASASSSGISLDSASVRATLRQAATEAQRMSKAMRVNYMNTMQDISTQRQNILGQRNLAAPELMVVMETTGGIVNSSSNIMATGFATGLMSGVSAGMSAYRAAK